MYLEYFGEYINKAKKKVQVTLKNDFPYKHRPGQLHME